MMAWFLVATGLILLLVGGEGLVRGSVTLATRLGISPLIIGLTLVGFGTSTPELATSIEAALKGSPAVAVGNVIGSNIANILLILGIGAVICPIACARNAITRDGTVAALSALAALGLVYLGEVSRLTGSILLALLAVYLLVTYRNERSGGTASGELHLRESETVAPLAGPAWVPALLALAGLLAILLGANLLVDGALVIARDAGIPEAVIGLTLVAIGTSLPELAVTIVAALRRQVDVALGNILGSNIFNILGILGATALVQPLAVPVEIARFDIWAMVGATAAMLVFAFSGRRIDRREGGFLLAAYAAYLWVQFDPGIRAALGLTTG